jgi:chlorophyllide a reductase subunit X
LGDAPPLRPSPLAQEALLGLFSGREGTPPVTMEPATPEDMRGEAILAKPTLEVVYDEL